jgi:hypothetical protein
LQGLRAAPAPGREIETAKLHLWRLLEHLALVDSDVEEFFLRESKCPCHQHGGELLDTGVVLLHRVVEEAARRGDLVFDIGQLGLELLEVLISLEVRIGFAEREQLPQCAAQHVLGCGLGGDPSGLRGDRGVARLHHRLQGTTFMRRVTLHRLDQVGNEVVALLSLHVDVGKGLVHPLPQGHKPVVDHDDPQHE